MAKSTKNSKNSEEHDRYRVLVELRIPKEN